MSYAHILAPTDGSERGRVARERALELARALGSRVTALYVADTGHMLGAPPGVEWQSIGDAMRAEGERALRDFEDAARAAGVEVRTRLVEGHPAQEIVRAAEDADLVVMGTLGRSGFAHLLLGSVAERVIRHAPCPVMVVRVKQAGPSP